MNNLFQLVVACSIVHDGRYFRLIVHMVFPFESLSLDISMFSVSSISYSCNEMSKLCTNSYIFKI